MALIVKRHAAVSSPDANAPIGPDAPSREEIARWLGLFAGDEGCVELRALGVSRKGQFGEHAESTFFAPTELDEMAKAARGLSGRARGVYFTLNPVHPGLLIDPACRAAGAKDILRRRWLLVDCDPIKPDADSSATASEKEASLAVAKAVRNHLRTKAWPEPILADSGNGTHLLYRIDLHNDDDTKALVKSALVALSARFSTPAVSIDTSVYDASRICKLYGTLTKKGEPTAERPHRFSRVLDVPSPIQVAGYEWVRDLGHDQAEPATIPIAAAEPRPKGIVAKARPAQDPKRAYAREALARECDGVATCPAGGRNNRLNQAAFSLGTLIGPDGLTEGEAIAGLAVAAAQAGLAGEEAQRTIQNGINAGKLSPRDMAAIGTAGQNGRANHNGNGNGVRLAIAGPDDDSPNENDDDPHRLARIFLKAQCHHGDGHTLRYWVERWHRWDGAAWRAVPDAEVSAEVTREIKREFDRIVQGSNKPPKPVTTKATSNVIQALKGLVLLTYRECPRQPAWLTDGPEPLECIAARNGILHLPSLAESPEPIPPTPNFFTSNAITYSFDPGAPEPKHWLAFLNSLWSHDPESIASLQEWFGYLLTADTRQQKMLMLIGPTRSGKGTICRVLESLVGSANVASPTLSSLALNFGVTPLIGKSLAIIPDARLSGRADGQVIIERLLSITGEDTQTIDRKHREDWTGSLRVRFVLGSNELPRLGDSSGAFPGRVVLLRLTRSFRDNPDHGLASRILAELPSILLWAIAGWARLRERGRFTQPASGQELLDELKDLSSPITTFLQEHCQEGSECEVPVKELYEAWKDWCSTRGKDHPGDQAGFGRQLRTVLPNLKTVQSRDGEERFRTFKGVALTSKPARERQSGPPDSYRSHY